jgi:hypothetical protein
MYEEIRRPTLLKHIPMLFIRSLSTIYYFGRYVDSRVPEKAGKLFTSNVNFLSDRLNDFGNHLSDHQFNNIGEKIKQLASVPAGEIQKQLENTTIELSQLCEQQPDTVECAFRELRMKFAEDYRNTVKNIKVLVIDNNNEPDGVNKIFSILNNFCYFETESTTFPSTEYPAQLASSDFAFFTSTYPSQIHDLVNSLMRGYQIPGLAIAYLEKEKTGIEQAIRHGAQLQRGGFYVIYKVFTPIRLFTSIDKIYMKYHLQNGESS